MKELPPEAQRKLEALPSDLKEIVAACFPDADAEAKTRTWQQQRDAARLRQEKRDLLDLADRAEAGEFGPIGKATAQQVLEHGGRTMFNLSTLRSALAKLRVTGRAQRVATQPATFSNVRGAR